MIIFLLTILFTNLSYSAELENFIFENEIKIENEKLILNGLAIRKVTIFNIKILVAGLYLTTKSNVPDLILNSISTKEIRIRFMKSISKEKISKMWSEQLLKRCIEDCITLKEQANQLGKLTSSAHSLKVSSGNEKAKTIFVSTIHPFLSSGCV